MKIQIGEGFVGAGPNAAHTNTILGDRSGPAGVAWATALATPRAGHVPFMVVVKHNDSSCNQIVTLPFLFNQIFVDQVPDGLGTVRQTIFNYEFVKRFQNIFIQADSKTG